MFLSGPPGGDKQYLPKAKGTRCPMCSENTEDCDLPDWPVGGLTAPSGDKVEGDLAHGLVILDHPLAQCDPEQGSLHRWSVLPSVKKEAVTPAQPPGQCRCYEG